jgi:hypothetical protein
LARKKFIFIWVNFLPVGNDLKVSAHEDADSRSNTENTMSTNTLTRRGISSLLLAATVFSSAVIAQGVGRPGPQKSIKPGKPDIAVNCCRCVGGKNDVASDISTGKASWTVSSTPTAPPPMPAGGWAVGPIAVVPTNISQQVAPVNIGPNPLPGTWTTISGADWIKPNGALPNGHWTYVLKVQVPNCTVPQKVVINGSLAADDYARMYVDGPSGVGTATLVGSLGAGFNGATRSFSAVLGPNPVFTKPGIYYIRVEMDNLGGAPAGIVLNGSLTGECSDKITRDDQKDGGGRED